MYYPSRLLITFIFSCSIAFSIFQLNVFAKDQRKQNFISQLIPSELGDVEQFKQDFETRYIPSKAMLPTFQVNDKVLIDKHTYRSQLPKRGDIILFYPPEALQKQGFKDVFTKRVIGLPGDNLEIKSGKVYINDRPLEESYILEPISYEHKKIKIPENSYFVLGDNRNNSFDSHYWGFVPRNYIYGKAIGIYCPIERQQLLSYSEPINAKNQAVFSAILKLLQSDPYFCNAGLQKAKV